jgi:ABC-type nitrate/sulfonate/bicarbonate transport system ATPase subunit
VVLSNGPAATIREIVEVPLARPRNKKDIVLEPEYHHIREHLLGLLTDKFSINDYKMSA